LDYKNHLLLGTSASLIFACIASYFWKWFPFTLETWVIVLTISLVSPLVPDLDIRTSKLKEFMIGLGLSIALLGLIAKYINLETNYWFIVVFGLLLASATFFNTWFTTHRGFYHSIPFCLIYGMVIWILNSFNIQFGVLAVVGCYSHLVGDSLWLKFK